MMEESRLISDLASIATAIGVFFAGRQLLLAKRQAQTDFEDGFSRDYREAIKDIPIGALLGRELGSDEIESHLDSFYRYIDLTNEQVFLRKEGRISDRTWANWLEGIQSNLRKPAFAKAWGIIKEGSQGSFDELRKLEGMKYMSDPKVW